MKRLATLALLLAVAAVPAQANDLLLGTLQHEDGETLLDLDTQICKSGTAARWNVRDDKIRIGCWQVASDRPNQILIFWLDSKTGTHHNVSEVVSLRRSNEIWKGRGRLTGRTSEPSTPAPGYAAPSRAPAPATRSRSMAELGYGAPAADPFPSQAAPVPPSHLQYNHRLSPAESVVPNVFGIDPYVYRRP